MRIPVTNSDGEQKEAKSPEQPAVEVAAEGRMPQPAGDGDRVAQLEQEVAQAQDRYLRALADLDNYRKRYDRELNRMREQERENLIRDLLPVADSLERAVTTENASSSPWFEGLMAVRRQID